MSSFQLNIGDHISPVAGYITFPRRYLDDMRWARRRAKVIARTMPSANVYFKTLPEGRTLTNLLSDRTIWVNYHPTIGHYGETEFAISGGNEIAISNSACRMGRWTLLGTLIHELAHTNGALGEPSHDAERALLHCGLGSRSEARPGARDNPRTPYNPGITG